MDDPPVYASWTIRDKVSGDDGSSTTTFVCNENEAVIASIRTVGTDKLISTLIGITENNGPLLTPINIDSGEFDVSFEIGISVFAGCTGLSAISFQSNVTTIGPNAFNGCTGLTSLYIPSSLTNIEDEAFTGCTSLTSIYISSDTQIGNNAFNGCPDLIATLDTTVAAPAGLINSGITMIQISSDTATIPPSAFMDCRSITTFYIPESVTTFGANAFDGCNRLRSLIIPPTVTVIETDAFANCPDLTVEIDPTNGTPAGLRDSGITSIQIVCTTTAIADEAFGGCSKLTSILIPPTVTSIGAGAFAGCGVTSILIPSAVTSIAPNAFAKCTGLVSVLSLGPFSVIENVDIKDATLYYDPDTPGWEMSNSVDISTVATGLLEELGQSYIYAIGPIKYAYVFINSANISTALATPELITAYAIICAVNTTTNSADFYNLIPTGNIIQLSDSQSTDVKNALIEGGITGELSTRIDIFKPTGLVIDRPSENNSSFFAVDSTTLADYTFAGSNDTLNINNGSHTFNTQLLAVGDTFTIQYTDGTSLSMIVNKFGSILATPKINIVPAPAPAPAPVPLHCYVKGSEILTQRGYVAIEDLNVGDLVVTKGKFESRPKPAIGLWTPPTAAKLESIVWKGHVTLSPKTDEHRPIRIKQNALGVNTPSKDLCVSPNHSVIHKGRVIVARDLLNGTSIVRDYCDEATYYHIKLKTHSIVIANGLTSESYKEDDTRDVSKFFEDSSKIRRTRFRIPFLGKH